MTRGDSLTGPITPLEIAAGRVFDPPLPRWTRPAQGNVDPREALEAVIERQVRRASAADGRVSVSFSGGRDSSLVLAVACHVARRLCVAEPVAVTMRHDSAESDETDWQELVIRHLGVSDWVRIDVGTEMDLLGPAASDMLERHGILSPPNAYLHLPMAQAAPAGVMLTGAGGDEVLGTDPCAYPLASIVAGRRRPRPRDGLSLGLAVAPRWMRAKWSSRGFAPSDSWLRTATRTRIGAAMAAGDVANRWRWDLDTVAFARSRTAALQRDALARVGATNGTPMTSPLAELDFVESFAAHMGAAGPPDRTFAMRRLAHDLLPDALLARQTKASFSAMVWGPSFRRFAATDEHRLPDDVAQFVDLAEVRREWRKPHPHFATMMLAQSAWLSSQDPS